MNSKSVNKQILFNMLSSTLISGIGLLTTPIFTRALGTIQYGKYAVFYSWVTIITCFMGLQIQTSISTGYYDYKNNYLNFRSGALIIGIILSGMLISILLTFSSLLSSWLGYSIVTFIMLLLCSFFHFVIDFARVSFIYEKKAFLNFIISTLLAISTVALSLLLLDSFCEKEQYLSRVYGITIPYCIIGIIIIIVMLIKEPTLPKKAYWKYSMAIGIPMVFHALSGKVLGQIDLIMLEKIGESSEAVGIYSFFHTYTSILTVILTALNNSWLPIFFDSLNLKQMDILKKRTHNYLELFTLICIVYILLSREVSFIFADSSYSEGIDLIPVFVLAIYFTFMYQFSVNYEMFRKKTSIIATGTFLAAILNVLLNLLLIPMFEMFGAAIATTLSFLGLFIAHYIISRKLQKGKSYVTILDFSKWFAMIILASIFFYLMKDFMFARIVIGVCMGILCIARIFKRRTIF